MAEQTIVSKEAYEAAGDRWEKARARMNAANTEAREAESALYEAEVELAAQEAAPGIPAYWHAKVHKDQCRIGVNCKLHEAEVPF